MVSSLTLCPDDAKHDPVVYGAEFRGVFPAKGPRNISIQKVLCYLGLYHLGLEYMVTFGCGKASVGTT